MSLPYPFQSMHCEKCGAIITYPRDLVMDFIASGKCGACLGKYEREEPTCG